MNARDTRKSVSALRKLCKEHGLKLEVVTTKGKGSHQALVFSDIETGESVNITIAGSKDISPGVQRQVIKYLTGLAVRLPLADIIRQIFESVFGN